MKNITDNIFGVCDRLSVIKLILVYGESLSIHTKICHRWPFHTINITGDTFLCANFKELAWNVLFIIFYCMKNVTDSIFCMWLLMIFSYSKNITDFVLVYEKCHLCVLIFILKIFTKSITGDIYVHYKYHRKSKTVNFFKAKGITGDTFRFQMYHCLFFTQTIFLVIHFYTKSIIVDNFYMFLFR